MKSPFPGMDPYLEWHWGDVHTRLTTYASNQLAGQLPSDLRVRIEEYVAVDDGDSDTMIPLRSEPPTLRYLRITDISTDNRLVTAIEFLHGANKVGKNRIAAYHNKQRELTLGGASLVEVDLLRVGEWVLFFPKNSVPIKAQGPYRACTYRAVEQGQLEFYDIPLRCQLPTISIPLRQWGLPREADLPLDLQELVELSYTAGRYDDIDYKSDPIPPLDSQDSRWVDELLKKKGLR